MNKKVWKFSQRISPGRWGARLTQCCLVRRWKENQNRASPPKPIPFAPIHLVGCGGGGNCSRWKSFNPGATQDLSSQDIWRSCPPSLNPPWAEASAALLEIRARAPAPGQRWRGRFASTREEHGVKFHLRCYLTILPLCFFSAETKLRPLQNEMCYPEASSSFGKNLESPLKSKKFTVATTSVHAFFGSAMLFLKITTSSHNFIN